MTLMTGFIYVGKCICCANILDEFLRYYICRQSNKIDLLEFLFPGDFIDSHNSQAAVIDFLTTSWQTQTQSNMSVYLDSLKFSVLFRQRSGS